LRERRVGRSDERPNCQRWARNLGQQLRDQRVAIGEQQQAFRCPQAAAWV
jgi:hypothetical protein